MKCLSLWQSWASLVVLGKKHFETRSWATHYRGMLLIHAAAKRDRVSLSYIGMSPFLEALMPLFNDSTASLAQCLPYGKILGCVDLVECWQCSQIYDDATIWKTVLTNPHGVKFPNQIDDQEQEFGDFSTGRFAWQLENVRRFVTPIPFKGWQGIFNVDDNLVAEQMAKAVAA